jgi:hypothetical protein
MLSVLLIVPKKSYGDSRFNMLVLSSTSCPLIRLRPVLCRSAPFFNSIASVVVLYPQRRLLVRGFLPVQIDVSNSKFYGYQFITFSVLKLLTLEKKIVREWCLLLCGEISVYASSTGICMFIRGLRVKHRVHSKINHHLW